MGLEGETKIYMFLFFIFLFLGGRVKRGVGEGEVRLAGEDRRKVPLLSGLTSAAERLSLASERERLAHRALAKRASN